MTPSIPDGRAWVAQIAYPATTPAPRDPAISLYISGKASTLSAQLAEIAARCGHQIGDRT